VALSLFITWYSALTADYFLLHAQKKVTKEKGTPSRFLIQSMNNFLNVPVHTHIHVLNELTANVLFAVAESS